MIKKKSLYVRIVYADAKKNVFSCIYTSISILLLETVTNGMKTKKPTLTHYHTMTPFDSPGKQVF